MEKKFRPNAGANRGNNASNKQHRGVAWFMRATAAFVALVICTTVAPAYAEELEPAPNPYADLIIDADALQEEVTEETEATDEADATDEAQATEESDTKKDAPTAYAKKDAAAKKDAPVAAAAPRVSPAAGEGYTIKPDTLSPTNTTINMFDYWEVATYTDASGQKHDGRLAPTPGWDHGGPTNSNQAINAGHKLKFARNTSNNNWGTANQYTNSKDVRQNIVQKTMDYGFPKLSANDGTMFPRDGVEQESLAYLFDPEMPDFDGRMTFANVQNLLSATSDGYLEYDSTKNAAWLDESTKTFRVYNESATCSSNGQFFPFNDPNLVESKRTETNGCQAGDLNHFFGMSLTANFSQRNGGFTDANRSKHTTFEFSGDDDVWVFIDDVLVADLGGIHGAATVSIDFVTGEVLINNRIGNIPNHNTTIKDAFIAANNAQGARSWKTNTFPNDTQHVLNFYYMERGSGESNMHIKYNLIDTPVTSIYKVDQYGDALAGAVFATYNGRQQQVAKDKLGPIEYLEEGTGNYVQWPSNAYVDVTTGNVYTDASKSTLLFKPTYRGVINSSGEFRFGTNLGDYSVEDLKGILGNEFILREIYVPEGYRTVSDAAALYFTGDLLQSRDPYGTGVWSAPNTLVTATNTLYLIDENGGHRRQNYYTLDSNGTYQTNGTLFATVQKRNGAAWNNLHSSGIWTPMYGNPDTGYKTEESTLQGAINASKHQAGVFSADEGAYGDPLFIARANGMQANLAMLPGFTTQYYSYVEEQYFGGDSKKIIDVVRTCSEFAQTYEMAKCKAAIDSGKATQVQLEALDSVEFYVSYFWTSADSLRGATPSNTWRVHSHRNSVDELDTDEFMGFDTKWGSTIKVPNAENRLIVQNHVYDEAPQRTDGQDDSTPYVGSWFAMYSVDEAKNGTMFYWAIPEGGTEEDKVAVYLKPDPKRGGILTDVAWLVNPATGERRPGTGEGVYRILTDTTDEQTQPNGDIKVEIDGMTYTVPVAKNAEGKRCVKATAEAADPQNPTYEDGAIYFSKLKTGKYVVRQITAPVNKTTGVRYGINIAESKVVVTDTAIYANAGGDRNGVLVGNGAGYLAKTLNMFAFEDDVDETLRWIAILLRTDGSQSFAAFQNFISSSDFKTAPYGSESDAAHRPGIARQTTTEKHLAMTSYLQFEPSSPDSFFDYAANADQNPQGAEFNRLDENEGTGTGIGEGMKRLYADDGWSKLEIIQDFGFGDWASAKHTNYADLRGRDLVGLFSNSTFVDYYNSPTNGPAIFKVLEGTDRYVTDENDNFVLDEDGNKQLIGYDTTLSGATFRVSREVNVTTESGETQKQRLYYSNMCATSDDGSETCEYDWQPNRSQAYVFRSDDIGMVWQNILLEPYSGNEGGIPQPIDYRLEEINAPEGYRHIASSIDFQLYNEADPVNPGVFDASVTKIRVTGVNGVSAEDADLLPAQVTDDGMRLYIANAEGQDVPPDDFVLLPNTGGRIPWEIIALGLALMVIAVSAMKLAQKRYQQHA
ncbi:hypothetical protein D2E26_1120 [Bifidobacterium dolichotidis]|uniref:PA14 domain-containing protein n=2 Tax=Bifidobacterium dolichotidis TaxID=2306976 RepID=A0A430FQH3_9BIFI|nr:hypothetical protein D2E26_1120 [Bifidobacterium dolichotidis]